MKENKSGWQFPKALEIIKCKEGNKEFMKERPARRPFGNTVLICEYPIDDTAARYSAIRLTDARSASGFKRLSRKRGGGIRLFYLSQRGQTQHIFTITFTGKRKSASCAGGYGSRTTTGTPPIPRPSLQW